MCFDKTTFIENNLNVLMGRNAKVIAALRAGIERLFELFFIDNFRALVAFCP
jgi:hypothetical protein